LFCSKQNNQYHFLKDYKIGLKVADSHQNDPVKLRYFKEFKANGLEELIDEHDYV
jgi:hypothetical protein